jgi:GNAT superfamily N-acetyltransferase
MEAIKGWFFDFIRDEERWFIIMITPELHGSGWGQKLISKAMETNAALNGWVVNTLDYQTRDGKQYAPPVEFYRKLGFEIHPDIKLELPQINSIKITWKK